MTPTDTIANSRDKMSEVAGKTKEAAQDTMGQIKESVSDVAQRGKEEAEKLTRSLETVIRDSPIKSVLVAAGVGLLVGVVWKLTA